MGLFGNKKPPKPFREGDLRATEQYDRLKGTSFDPSVVTGKGKDLRMAKAFEAVLQLDDLPRWRYYLAGRVLCSSPDLLGSALYLEAMREFLRCYRLDIKENRSQFFLPDLVEWVENDGTDIMGYLKIGPSATLGNDPEFRELLADLRPLAS